MANDDLALRDIHLPTPIAWWPPAPGWWLVVALLILAGAGLYTWKRLRGRPPSLKKLALIELDAVEQRYRREADRQQLIKDLSILYRRLALSMQNRSDVAAMTGTEWLHALDKMFGVSGFSSGPGSVLAIGPYQPTTDYDADELLAFCRRAVSNLPSRPDHDGLSTTART